jgi:hypothetical protein
MGPGLRANNVTRAVELVATGQQGLPVWPGLTSRKLRCTAARVRREEVRSWRTARLYELLLAAEQVQASKSALRTAGEQRYPSSGVGGHRPAMAACMARLNVAEGPLDGGRGRRMAAGAAGWRQGPHDGGWGRMRAAGAAGSSCTPADGDAVA